MTQAWNNTGRSSNYQITVDYQFGKNYADPKTLPAGTFVRPLQLNWVPAHVLANNLMIIEDRSFRWFDKELDSYCYCSAGIIPIPNALIRKCD